MSGYKFDCRLILSLITLCILSVSACLLSFAANADSEPRWVPIPDTPYALSRHFGMSEYNCYELAEKPRSTGEKSGLENLIIGHQFNPDFEQPGEKRTDYSPNVLVEANGKNYFAFGQCHTEEGALDCGIQCDGGPFQLFDVNLDHIILHNGGFSAHDCEEEDETAQLNFTPAIFGATFLLKRMDDKACKSVLEN